MYKNNIATPDKARLRITAEQLAERLEARRSGGGYLACCPAHNDATPSLYFKDGDQAILFKCFAGCSSTDIIRNLRAQGHLPSTGNDAVVAPTNKTEREEAEEKARQFKLEKARLLWHTSKPISEGDPAHTYLTKVCGIPLDIMSGALRLVPSLAYWSTEGDGRPIVVTSTPAMLAAITSANGELVAVHRTYLTPDGRKFNAGAYGLDKKSNGAKKVLGSSINGGAIRLHDPSETLVLAEGIETALAAHILSGCPAWATISAGGLARVEIPNTVTTAIICIDNDAAGEMAATKLAARLMREGRQVLLSRASCAGVAKKGDWADVMGGAA